MLRGASPARVLQGVASGLFGPSSFQGGAATAAVGAAVHFLVAFSAATAYYLASRRLPVLTRRPVLCGGAYGIAVYLVMYWIVTPLSRIGPRPFVASTTALAIATHIVCVGLPIALVVHHFSRRGRAAGAAGWSGEAG